LKTLIEINDFYSGALSEATITHNYFIGDVYKCFYEAAENQTNQSQVFNYDKLIPFRNFRWYYGKKRYFQYHHCFFHTDADLNRCNFIRNGQRTIYNSLEFLLQNTM
jgi:hypothetical protein